MRHVDDMNDKVLRGMADTEEVRANPKILENLGRLAAFLDGFDGHPLDGLFCFYEFTAEEKGIVARGYRSFG